MTCGSCGEFINDGINGKHMTGKCIQHEDCTFFQTEPNGDGVHTSHQLKKKRDSLLISLFQIQQAIEYVEAVERIK